MMTQNEEKIAIDSNIIISILKKDEHFNKVKEVILLIKKLKINVIMSYISYAEIWFGVLSSKSPKEEELKVNKSLYELFEVDITDFNITIARTAAAAFLKYKKLKGKRETLIPDFLIGAHAKYYANRILTTNPRDFLKYIPELKVLTPDDLLNT